MGRGLLKFIDRFPGLNKISRWGNDILADKLGVRLVSSRSLTFDVSAFWRIPFYKKLFDLVEGIPGDIVECGVFEGNTLSILATLNIRNPIKRRIWAFDSFEGLPSPTDNDLDRPTAIGKKGMFSSPESRVWRKLKSFGFGYSSEPKITLVKGWFADTLPNYRGEIAFLHIDADLYESFRCINIFLDRGSFGLISVSAGY